MGIRRDDDDPEHRFSPVIAAAALMLDDIGQDGVRELIRSGAELYGYKEGVKVENFTGPADF